MPDANRVERRARRVHLLPVNIIRVAEAGDLYAECPHFLKQFPHAWVVAKDPRAVDAVDLSWRMCSAEGFGNCGDKVRVWQRTALIDVHEPSAFPHKGRITFCCRRAVWHARRRAALLPRPADAHHNAAEIKAENSWRSWRLVHDICLALGAQGFRARRS